MRASRTTGRGSGTCHGQLLATLSGGGGRGERNAPTCAQKKLERRTSRSCIAHNLLRSGMGTRTSTVRLSFLNSAIERQYRSRCSSR
eukprot:766568-Hanusia_phi.AAC.5